MAFINTLAIAYVAVYDTIIHNVIWITALITIAYFVVFHKLYLLIIIPIIYLIWYILDSQSCHRGGWKWRPLENSSLYKLAADYHPVNVIKTADIPADRNYIFCFHPHGYYPNAFLNFFPGSNRVNKLLPDFRFTKLTLDGQFKMPFHRELRLAQGCASISKQNIGFMLRERKNIGKVDVNNGNVEKGLQSSLKFEVLQLIPGGFKEILYADKKSMKLNLKNRKGFVKIAMKYGVDLVPVITFGEGDVYDVIPFPKGSIVNWFQEFGYKYFGIGLPVAYGRGLFQNFFGFVPRKTNITTVIGEPMSVKKYDVITDQDLDQMHQNYVEKLKKLFYDYRDKYDYGDVEIEIL